MKFTKTKINFVPCHISQCGEYKIVKYGKSWFLFHKIDSIGKNGKKIRAFGDSVEYDTNGKVKTYKTFHRALKRANMI